MPDTGPPPGDLTAAEVMRRVVILGGPEFALRLVRADLTAFEDLLKAAAVPYLNHAETATRASVVVDRAEQTLTNLLDPWLPATVHGSTLRSQIRLAAQLVIRDIADLLDGGTPDTPQNGDT